MLRLLAIPFSTNVERVRLALGHKGLAAEVVDVDPADRRPVVAVSGQPLVPVLVDGDAVVADSLAILRHLEQRQPAPPLFPADPGRRAEVDRFLDWFDGVWKRAPNRLADGRSSHPRADAAAVREGLDVVARALADGRPFLFGPFGAADCAAFPFLRYALGRAPEDDEPFHRVLADHLPPGPGHGAVRGWIARVDARPRG